MKISRRKLSRVHTIDRILVVRARDVHEENFRERADIREIRESFLPRKFPNIRYSTVQTIECDRARDYTQRHVSLLL